MMISWEALVPKTILQTYVTLKKCSGWTAGYQYRFGLAASAVWQPSVGKHIFKNTTQKCIHENTPAFDTFMRLHDEAGKWAKANRLLIAIKMLGDISHPIIDISHNFVTKLGDRFLCRKGAASTNQGPIILPGSRGTSSFILNPTLISDATGWSGPHGCGRRLSRNSASLKALIKLTERHLQLLEG